MSLGRIGQALGRALLRPNASGRITEAPFDTLTSSRIGAGLAQPRRFASGHGSPGVTYEGLTLHKPARWHKITGEAFAGLMWFWIFVRAYHDGNTLLFGHAQHFEHEAHETDDHKGHS